MWNLQQRMLLLIEILLRQNTANDILLKKRISYIQTIAFQPLKKQT